MKKQLTLFPELDLSSKEPIIYDGGSGQFINKFKEKEVGPFETALNNVQNKGKNVPVRKPKAVPPKTKTIQKFANGGASKRNFRQENFNERLERLMYEHGESNVKPKHYDDPRIVDFENMKQKPKPFNNSDSSTFPSDRSQRQKMNSWDVILDSTIKSGTPTEKKEMREYLREKYNDKDQRKYLTKKELKFISAYNEPKKVEQPLTNILPVFDPPKPIQPDPETLRLEQRYKQILEESEREKRRNQTTGLAGLLGIK